MVAIAMSSIVWPVKADWRSGRNRRNQSARRAAYSWTFVCQLAASGRCRWCASPAPRIPTSLGPVMWIRSGWNRSRTSPIKGMCEISGIETQVFLEREGQKATRQLERPHISFFDGSLGAVAGTHTEEGQVAAAGKRFKIPAGVRHPVHFVERVGEVSDARWFGCHLLSELAEKADSTTVVAFSLSPRLSGRLHNFIACD